MNVAINTARVQAFNNPPAVTGYLLRIFSGPPTNNTLVRSVTVTLDQARSPVTVTMSAPGTYSVGVAPVGVNGRGALSPRSNYIPLAVRRRTATAGRRLAGAEQEASVAEGAPQETAAIAQPKRRSRHLL